MTNKITLKNHLKIAAFLFFISINLQGQQKKFEAGVFTTILFTIGNNITGGDIFYKKSINAPSPFGGLYVQYNLPKKLFVNAKLGFAEENVSTQINTNFTGFYNKAKVRLSNNTGEYFQAHFGYGKIVAFNQKFILRPTIGLIFHKNILDQSTTGTQEFMSVNDNINANYVGLLQTNTKSQIKFFTELPIDFNLAKKIILGLSIGYIQGLKSYQTITFKPFGNSNYTDIITIKSNGSSVNSTLKIAYKF